MNKIRYWDNKSARWLLKHFYFTFFQFILIIIFLFWFANTLRVIDANIHSGQVSFIEHILTVQTTNMSIVVFILILNSFWMLFIFNGLQRIRTLLKDISFHLGKIRSSKGSRQ